MNGHRHRPNEHRRELRIPDAIGIRVAVIMDHGFKTSHEATDEHTVDISEDGLRFFDEWGLPDGALLEIQMHTKPDTKPIVHYGRVRWKRPAADRDGYDVGVQFVQASREDRDAWLAYVHSRSGSAPTARFTVSRGDAAPLA